MIQRPQSIYLLIVTILNLAVFFNPIYSRGMDDPAEWIGLLLAISLTLAMVIAFVSIFFYNNRVFQLNMVKFATFIQVVAFGTALGVLFSMGGFGTYLVNEVLGILFIFSALIMLWLAGRQIRKDEELVKSMDRIR